MYTAVVFHQQAVLTFFTSLFYGYLRNNLHIRAKKGAKILKTVLFRVSKK